MGVEPEAEASTLLVATFTPPEYTSTVLATRLKNLNTTDSEGEGEKKWKRAWLGSLFPKFTCVTVPGMTSRGICPK
jgi:hypothetical protein